MAIKSHEVREGDRIVAWSKEAHRYVAVSVWKINASSCQGKDKNLEIYKGLEYKNCWTVEAFQQQKPNDYNDLFGKKDEQVAKISSSGEGNGKSEVGVGFRDEPSGDNEQGSSNGTGDGLPNSEESSEGFGATRESQEREEELKEWDEHAEDFESWKTKNPVLVALASAPSDSSRVSAGSSREPNQLADSSGLNQLKLTPTQEPFSVGTTTTPSTETSEPTSQSETQQTASLADSPAPEPVTLENATDLNMKSQVSGGNSTELSSESDPALSLSSNRKVCGTEDLISLSAPLPKSGMWANGSVYQQPTLERPTLGSESSSLPTPTTYAEGSGEYRPAGLNKLQQKLRLPTPIAKDGQSRPAEKFQDWSLSKEMGKAIAPGEVMNPEVPGWMMGFPPGYAELPLADGGQKTNPQLMQEYLKDSQQNGESASPSTAEASPHSKQQLHSVASSTSTHSCWIDPRSVVTDAGTQSRAWEDAETIDDYTEKMLAGLWDWERQPLPVVFFDGENYYPGDCHHRVKAAIKAEQDLICVDVREGSLRDAIVYSCQANTDHGIPLRPRDQRRRIEMLLDQLAVMSGDERITLLDKVPGVKEQERAHVEKTGEWSNRVIARYLKLTANGYVTVANIQKERQFKQLITELELKEGDRFQHKEDGELCALYVISYPNQKVSVLWDSDKGVSGLMLLDEFLENFISTDEPKQEKKVEAEIGCKNLTPASQPKPDLLDELEERSDRPQLLPDIKRTENPAANSHEDGSQADTTELLLNQLFGQLGLLSDAQLQQMVIKAKAELNRRQEYRRSA